ncbi:MAG: peptidylprolyl isomerase [Moraxella sp.]|nr:peptidylprolyl isomerase [Moraxella sp.]
MKYTKLSFLLTAIISMTSAHAISVNDSKDGILAQVNDEIILKSEFLNATQTLANQYQAQNITISNERLQTQTLDELITRKLQLDIIHRSGFRPDESAINRQLQQIAQSQGFGNLSDFQKHLDGQKMGSYVALRNQVIEDASLVALWQAQVAPRIKISDQEIDAFLASPEGAGLPSTPVLIPEWQTSHILAKIDDGHSPAMSEQKIKALYTQLQQGADFQRLATTYSDDVGSATQNGSLGWVGEGQMVPEFEAVMKNTEVGDFSTPFRSQFGWHILKVNNIRQKDVTQENRRMNAREILFNRLAPQAEEDWLQELRAGAYIKLSE